MKIIINEEGPPDWSFLKLHPLNRIRNQVHFVHHDF